MKIGINGYEANVEKRVGSNQYAFQVLVQLEKLTQHGEDEIVVYLPSAPVNDMPKERQGWQYKIIGPAAFWSLWRLPIELYFGLMKKVRHDVFLSLGHYAPRFCPFPSVVCIMDVAYLMFPNFFKRSDVWKLKTWTSYSVHNAKHIIAISECTKRDVMKYYARDASDITVAYPGFEEQEFVGSTRNVLKKLKVTQPYIVYVGTMQPRKNLVRLVKAFELLIEKGKKKDMQLVLAGKVGWMSDELIKAVQHSSAHHHIHMVGFVTDEEKFALYTHAEAAVLIGLYEGFGIPALEAMSANTLPVVSQTASLPEVVGDAGILVDPYSVEDIARGVREALEYTPGQRATAVQRGRDQVAKFSWEHTGRVVLSVLYQASGIKNQMEQVGGTHEFTV